MKQLMLICSQCGGNRILFSANEGFETNIRRGFKSLRYEILFDGFAIEISGKATYWYP
jgi:hypothetical protein